MSSEDTPALKNPAPKHVAIIMDGNGRWARSRNKPRIDGHRQGVENLREVVQAANDLGVVYLTVYAFSAENWSRPDKEIDALMELLEAFLKRYTKELLKNDIKLHVIGDLSALPKNTRSQVEKTIEASRQCKGHNLVLALNYGGRQEVVRAAQQYAKEVSEGRVNPQDLDWDSFSNYLYTNEIPDPELLIRTSGEMRMSNFLLLQCAYSELVFSPLYWPDFGREAFEDAIIQYRSRERRFGLTGEQLQSPEGEELTTSNIRPS